MFRIQTAEPSGSLKCNYRDWYRQFKIANLFLVSGFFFIINSSFIRCFREWTPSSSRKRAAKRTVLQDTLSRPGQDLKVRFLRAYCVNLTKCLRDGGSFIREVAFQYINANKAMQDGTQVYFCPINSLTPAGGTAALISINCRIILNINSQLK